jgi:hypothetical protein
MKRTSDKSVVLLVCLLSALALAQHRKSQSVERQHVLDGQFTVIARTEDMPPNAKRAFSQFTLDPSFALANPGEKYQVNDVVMMGQNLPFRRLLFAGQADNKWFIHYEKGGRLGGYYVLVFTVNQLGTAQFVWGGGGAKGAKGLEQLRGMVAAGQFSEQEHIW